jgi:hypothetical protein
MLPRLSLVTGIVALAAALAAGARAAEPPRPPVALAVRDPIHQDLEALAARGVIVLLELHSRPLLRFDVAHAIVAALARDSTLAGDATMRRVTRAFAAELAAIGAPSHPAPARTLIDLRDEHNHLRAVVFTAARAEGAVGDGYQFVDSTRVGVAASWIVWPNFHLFEEVFVARIPRGRDFGDPISPGTDVNTSAERVYAALHTRYADLVFGRDRLAFGPGAQGSLLLSPSAPPFTHLRISGTFFSGRLHGVIVNGLLDQAENRYVAFHRLDWRVHPRLSLGFAEGSRYNASGFQPLYVIGIIPYQIVTRLLLRDNESPTTAGSVRDNVMLSVDARWRPIDGFDLYGEALLDDLGLMSDDHPTRLAWQVGALHTGSLFGRELRTRLEWTRVWNWVYTTFYHADFVHEGRPLGYPYGPDCRVIDVRSEAILGRDWTLSAAAGRRDQGEGRRMTPWLPAQRAALGTDAGRFQGVVETEWRLAFGFRYAPIEHIGVEAEAGPAWVSHAGNVPGVSRRGFPGRFAISMRY